MARKKPATDPEHPQSLRRRAEELLRTHSTDVSAMSPEDIQALIHELEVHQIELQLQNEELREAQLSLAESHDRYSDLFEFAPVGYLTLDARGRILEGNLAAAATLGGERKDLVGTAISHFITRESQDECYFHLQAVFSSDRKHLCELAMHRKDGTPLTLRLESVAQQPSAGGVPRCRTALIDVTDLRAAQQQLRRLNEELEQRIDARTVDLRSRTDQLAHQSTELERREREFRTLVDNVPGLFSYVGPDQRYRYVNRRYEELFQQPTAEIVGKTMAQVLGPDRYQVVRPHVEAALRGEVVTFEINFDPAGRRHTMHVNYVPDLDREGSVQGFFALLTDVTEWKQTEQQAKLLTEAVSHLGEGVLITSDDLDWPGPQIVFVNQAMCHITGYAADELIGKTPRVLQGNGTSRETRKRMKADLSAGRSCLVELVNYRKDRTPYHAEVFITPLFDSEGRRTNFVSIHRDITERKEAEAAVRDREERMGAILNTAADAVVTIDRHGIIDSVNPATEKMFGYPREELVGKNIKVLMPPPYHDEHDNYIKRYLETGEAGIIGIGREVTGRRKDGSLFPVDLAVSEIEHLGLFTGIIRDISERKELQERILKIAAEEQRRIGHDLHDDVGQELTGLGLFAAAARTALQRKAFPEAEEMTSKLVDDIKRTLGKVRALSRGLNPVEVDSEGLMSALTELARRTSEAGSVSCTFTCEHPVRFRDNAVATHLLHIAQEATSNAVKHGPAAHVGITLAEENGVVTLSIRDDGRGIDLSGQMDGLGLRIMRYRADLIHAKLVIEPIMEGGTLVRCILRGSSPD